MGGPGRRPARRRRALRAARRPRLHPRPGRRGSAGRRRAARGRRPARLAPRRLGARHSRSTRSSLGPRGSTACGCASGFVPMPEAFLPAALRGPARDGSPRLAPPRHLRGSGPGPRGRGPAARAAVIVALAGGHRRRQAPARPGPRDGAGPPLHHRQHRRRSRLVGTPRLARSRLRRLRPRRPPRRRAGLGSPGRHLPLPGSDGRLGRETWFRLGDRDLATHLHRTLLLRAGASLTDRHPRDHRRARRERRASCRCPTSPVRTELRTDSGWLSLEEFFVRERCAPDVLEVAYRGAEEARPAPRRPRGDRLGGGGRRVLLESRDVDRADPRRARGSSTPWRARRRPSSP